MKDGIPISHLFFVDNLILFAKVAMEQMEVIRYCLETFCLRSREKVNKAKSKILFFPRLLVITKLRRLLMFFVSLLVLI